MKNRAQRFRAYAAVDPQGRPRKPCEMCGDRPATRRQKITKANGRDGYMPVCEDCWMPVEKDAETGEWVVDLGLI